MAVTIPDFWKLVVESRLLSAEQCQKLAADFTHVKGAADQGNSKTLGEWLVARNALSRYQTMVLMAGRAGPFYYGDYRVYERVEQGALKGQFRAIHAPTGHPTMLRFLTGSVVKDPREWAGAAARVVKQTGVVYPLLQRYFEPVDLQAFKFVVTEDLRGETLDELLAKSGRLHPLEACRIVRHAAFALAYLHQVGIIHGDVRPQHLLLEPSGNVKLLIDPTVPLGLVNVAQIDPQSPAAAKADYLAPDFLKAGKFPDELTDVYALGCTLYQLLTGQVPFPGGLPGQKLARHAAERIQPLEPYGIPQPLAQLVAYMMAKNSASRYQQASVVAEQLVPFIDPAHLQIPASSPPPTLAAYESWIKQKQAVLSTAATKPAAAPRVDVTAAAASGPLLVKTDASAST
ncbi:MAG TPA: serine/threonine-protein kinase, partial [Pirellulaceae bacterium]|nr:serine/threonine-protein kinase [Pirellulaceae bacterium]